MTAPAAAPILVAMTLAVGCSSGTGAAPPDPDRAAARRFAAFPLYWVGAHFERWDLVAIDGLDATPRFVSLIYGTCMPGGGDEPSCTPPFQIQISRLCSHLDVVASDPVWRTRRVRGAPVGRNPDGAPILFGSRVQIKVYRGQGSDGGLPGRVLRGLRSLNRVPPVLEADDEIPGADEEILAGERRCG